MIGAGIAGLSAARCLLEQGGATIFGLSTRARRRRRMASRRMDTPAGQARFDHGAQFFTTRSDLFRRRSHRLSGWGGGRVDEGFRRRGWVSTVAGSEGMTSLCKWLAADAGIVPELGTRILDLGDELAARPVDAVIHTAPVPQALATMAFGGLLPGIELAQQLTGIHYKPTIAVMVAPAVAPTGWPIMVVPNTTTTRTIPISPLSPTTRPRASRRSRR